jgi:hypothetical protein
VARSLRQGQRQEAIFAARDQKILQARETRKPNATKQLPLISCHPNFFQLTLN